MAAKRKPKRRMMTANCDICEKLFSWMGVPGNYKRKTCGQECERKSASKSRFAKRAWPDAKTVAEESLKLRADRSQRRLKGTAQAATVNVYKSVYEKARKFAGTK